MEARKNRKLFYDKSTEDENNINIDHLYAPRAGDVIITGPVKSGTTWLQQILHQIRTKGDESFKDIFDVTWFIQVPKLAANFNFNNEQVCNPRIYKCHHTFEDVPKKEGVKHIVIVRNPYDTSYSYTRFNHRFWGSDEDVDEETMASYMKLESGKGSFFGKYSFMFFNSWWHHRKDSNVFWVHYEDLLQNLELITKQLADFIEMPLNDEELKRICSMCTFGYMSKHADKFTADPVADLFARSMDREKWKVTSSMVRTDGGKSGQGKEKLTSNLRQTVDDLWEDIVTKQLGFANYDEIYLEGTRLKK
jgi:hypothetical protein